MLTTWPIQAPLVCAREGKKGILTNCADTARLVGRSRCCKSLVSRRLVQSSLTNLFVSHEVCLWNVSSQEDLVYSCNPDEEATAFPSEEDEAMREWRQEFPEQLRRVIVQIHTNFGHPHNSTLAKMISDFGESEEMINVRLGIRVPCASECPGLVSDVLCYLQEHDNSMTLSWLMCISGITKAVKFWCTR